jgi:hypothetical protein
MQNGAESCSHAAQSENGIKRDARPRRVRGSSLLRTEPVWPLLRGCMVWRRRKQERRWPANFQLQVGLPLGTAATAAHAMHGGRRTKRASQTVDKSPLTNRPLSSHVPRSSAAAGLTRQEEWAQRSVDLEDRGGSRALESDLVDGGEEWELALLACLLEARHHVLGRARALRSVGHEGVGKLTVCWRRADVEPQHGLHHYEPHHVLRWPPHLQLLAVELLRLNGVPRLALTGEDRLTEDLGALAVPPAEAGRHEVGDTARLEKRLAWLT